MKILFPVPNYVYNERDMAQHLAFSVLYAGKLSFLKSEFS